MANPYLNVIKYFLKAFLVFARAAKAQRARSATKSSAEYPLLVFWFCFLLCCYLADEIHKEIHQRKEEKKRLDFQQDLLLVSLSFMQIFTCGKCRDRSCDISPRCALSNQVTVGGLKTAHFFIFPTVNERLGSLKCSSCIFKCLMPSASQQT